MILKRIDTYELRLNAILADPPPHLQGRITGEEVRELKRHYSSCRDTTSIVSPKTLSIPAYVMHDEITEEESLELYKENTPTKGMHMVKWLKHFTLNGWAKQEAKITIEEYYLDVESRLRRYVIFWVFCYVFRCLGGIHMS